ncbi:DeoR/GlpR family DNA-binding transcription regulator [Pseudonocardia sp. MH-G8]|uniref:DeoR/GlpR family DNA-binding transcription regulator n=1 Tax=Pseudonocardia sp. MH-G8 TaxID=1854588 RepID=UPI000B9FF5B2|nr:DeoR/GlpR family DNA-binding transcription regulator [Pseudonocardia sp. MH-G8]OZM78025.1 DeoR family transcriptional regulator [Pseudonocardia sp. MH-G8]
MSRNAAPLLPGPRRERILAIVEQHGFAKVADLSKFFGVSEVTIRTDLDALARTRVVQRVHGGAVSGLRSRALERPFEKSMLTAVDEKKRIGRAASGLVKSYQAVMIDVGTTTTAVARSIASREDLSDVVIITNALNIALVFERAIPRFTVIVTGGTLRPEQHSLVDPLADMLFERMQADIAFVGCTGIDLEVGITNANVPEADMKRRMLQAAHRGVVVADSQKIGMTQLSRVAGLDEIDTLITGSDADPERLERIRNTGLEVLTA